MTQGFIYGYNLKQEPRQIRITPDIWLLWLHSCPISLASRAAFVCAH